MRISDWSSDVCSSDLATGTEGLAVSEALLLLLGISLALKAVQCALLGVLVFTLFELCVRVTLEVLGSALDHTQCSHQLTRAAITPTGVPYVSEGLPLGRVGISPFRDDARTMFCQTDRKGTRLNSSH